MIPLLTVFCPGLEHRNFVDQATRSRMRELPVEFLYLADNDWRSLGEKTRLLIQMARAPWVCGMGDDDLLHPQFFDCVLPLIKSPFGRNKLELVGFNVEVIGDKGPALLCRIDPGQIEDRSVERWEGKTQFRPYAMPCPIKKSMFDNITWPDTSYGEDHQLITQIGPKLKEWFYIDKTLYYAFPRNANPDRKEWSHKYGDKQC